MLRTRVLHVCVPGYCNTGSMLLVMPYPIDLYRYRLSIYCNIAIACYCTYTQVRTRVPVHVYRYRYSRVQECVSIVCTAWCTVIAIIRVPVPVLEYRYVPVHPCRHVEHATRVRVHVYRYRKMADMAYRYWFAIIACYRYPG